MIDTEGGNSVEAPQYENLCEDTLEGGKDALEEKLEAVLFGKQSYQPVTRFQTGLWEPDGDIDEVRHGSTGSRNCWSTALQQSTQDIFWTNKREGQFVC